MTPSQPAAGYFRSGLPYNRLGRGPRPLVVVQGLTFENKPQSGLATSMYRFLGQDYTVFALLVWYNVGRCSARFDWVA